MVKRKSSKRKSSKTRTASKKLHPIRTLLGIVVVLAVAGAAYLYTGEVPPEIQELLPQELQDMLFKESPTDTPTPETPTTSETLQPGTPAMNLPKIAGNGFNDSFNKFLLYREFILTNPFKIKKNG